MFLGGLIQLLIMVIPLLSEALIATDAAIYGIARRMFDSFFELISFSSHINDFSTELSFIVERITVLAGVYALFRLGIMLINYLIDPAKLKNANKNGTDIIKGVVVSIVLLIASPLIFKELNQFQELVLIGNDNVEPLISTIIYGKGNEATESKNNIKQTKKFTDNMWLLFFREKKEGQCNNSNSTNCKAYKDLQAGTDNYTILNLATAYFSFDYTPVVPEIVGIALCYFAITFTVELAIRLFKLLVLQVIAPIPIIMYIDPSQRDKLKKFAKEYLNIFLQVFFRVLTFYLAFVVIYIVSSTKIDNSELGIYLQIILIIGVFAAAKELPKLLENIIGANLGGSTAGGNSFGKVIAGIAGGGIGLVGGAVAGGVSGGGGGALAGAVSGMFGGATGMVTSKNAAAGISSAIKNIKNQNALGGKIYGAGGLGQYMKGGAENFLGGKKKDAEKIKNFDKMIGDKSKEMDKINSEIGSINTNIDARNQANSLRDNLQSTMDNSFTEKYGDFDTYFTSMNGGVGDDDYNRVMALQRYVTAHENTPGYDSEDLNAEKYSLSVGRKQLEDRYNQEKATYFDEQLSQGYISPDAAGPRPANYDANIQQALKEYNDFVESHGMSDRTINSYSGSNGVENSKKSLENDIKEYRKTIEQKQAEVAQIEQAKKEIEKQKKDFMETDAGYIRRNKRDEETISRGERLANQKNKNGNGS